ncbi:MAG: ABC transporter substrate-binding protein [Burkholderiaceae bacterium]
MKQLNRSRIAAAVLVTGAMAAGAGVAQAQETIKMAVPTFLTGAGAPAFGVPGKNGAEIIIEAINAGTLPAPYSGKGLAGRMIEAVVYDEAGGNTKQVAEFRNKVQKQGIELFAGFVSSGTCAALTPVAEELKVLTIYATCGTPRVFEEINPDPKYVFRTSGHATADNVAAAHYVKAKMGDVKSYAGINQNYAWGQDSWRDFDLTMQSLATSTKASDKLQWPKIFAGQYGAEVSALLLSKDDLVHSSFWGGDLEAFIFQAAPRGLFSRKKVVLTVGGTAVYRLGKKMPEGVVLGARGPYGIYATSDSALNTWFRKTYIEKNGTPPTGPAYQYAQAVIGAKYAYDKAAKDNGGKFPSTEQVIAALKNAEFESVSTMVKMSLGNGHQAVTEHVYGITKWDKEKNEMGITDVVKFSGDCVMPPAGAESVAWIKGGMKGAKCS